ncbi:proline-specific peptidase [Amylostereum chailletii]|nr:proline-specific peptidase [Amylostereum chailletii]
MSESTGTIDFVFEGETFKTWYKLVGDLKSGATPLVLLHGGPGVTHKYLISHAKLTASRGIPVIFYDQIGCGQSTHLKDRPKEFWSIPLFIAELDNLLAHFQIADNFNLLGHSWGGVLASEYAATRQPKGLRRLVLANSLASMPLWEISVSKLLKRMPQEIQDTLKKHEEDGTMESKEFQDAMNIFYQKHMCNVNPWPQELIDSFDAMGQDPTVYVTMQGPSEFTITGTLKTWTIEDRLHTITQPTLVLNSIDDEAQDECVGPLFQKIPRSKWVQFARSSHMPFLEEEERYLQVVGDYLTQA